MDNPATITLTDLQSEKNLLDREAAVLRQSLHELHQAGREHALPAHVWQAKFARRHEKLVIVAGKIGRLDKRILALVEGKRQSDPESASG
jgi:hypothetical protein